MSPSRRLSCWSEGNPAARWGNRRLPSQSHDAFVAAEHQPRGLKPRPKRSKSILLRRVYLDLIGLTPTVGEQRQFEADNSVDAYDKVVDRLLKDPRYGNGGRDIG